MRALALPVLGSAELALPARAQSVATVAPFFVWLGGTVAVAPAQASGQYSAPILLTLTYTGA